MKHALIVFVAVAALVFVGCSGSDSSSSPATTSPTLASDSNTPSADGSGTPDTAASSDSNSDSQAADSSVAADVDPCSLLTTAEIKDAAGFEVAEGQASDAPMGSKACSYFGKQSADELVDSVIVMVEPQEVWQHFFDLGPSTPGQSGGALTIKKISGIGDSAYSKAPTNGDTGDEVHTGFQKSGAYILLGITMNNTPQSKILDAEKTLATTAASKL